MYDNYKFKNTSLLTMNYLLTSNPEMKEKIISRGLDVLFSEPNMKAEQVSKEDKTIIADLISIIKKGS
jgi:hypothetical protein